ncbi:MAG: hypothetical protein MR707_06325, partial [Galactobacillus timonensis]|uniref:hypothetical protein n=1 Tax=Galactobacillus timonensis TaxID=2041840 RepID=UPI0023F56642
IPAGHSFLLFLKYVNKIQMNPGPPKLNSGGPPKWSPKLHSPKDFGDPKPPAGGFFCGSEIIADIASCLKKTLEKVNDF